MGENQLAYWSGEAGQRWVREQERMDAVLAPLGAVALAKANARPGERVLDVGCGCGASSLALVDSIGPTGALVGVDISAPMLARARERAAAKGISNATFLEADAATFQPDAPFDLLFSRFGIMFFEDPEQAFANLYRSTSKRGRITFSCWRPIAENPWVTTPFAEAVKVVPPPPPSPPDAPGPFAFGDAARVLRILQNAGFREASATPSDVPVRLGPLEAATEYALMTGPTGRLLAGQDDATRERVRALVREALRRYESPEGVELPAATWVVHAKKA